MLAKWTLWKINGWQIPCCKDEVKYLVNDETLGKYFASSYVLNVDDMFVGMYYDFGDSLGEVVVEKSLEKLLN